MPLSALVCWVVIIILVIFFQPEKISQLNLEYFVNILIGGSGTLSGINIIYKVSNSPHLRNLLGYDAFTVFIGASVVIWMSIQQMLKPF
ncbi:hypothetical protein Riv7116_4953 [Rivularia sp. PCC 7116]|nr:hypothetical protein Riv7116_4953 [Rivularia sp. PCC 7116]